MVELRNEKIAVPVVLFAGILWSFGPLVVRYMNDPHMVPSVSYTHLRAHETS